MSTNLTRLKQLISDYDELKRFVSEVFKKVDRDRSGFIDSMQVGNILDCIANQLGFNPPMKYDTEDIVRLIDKNGDQRISRIQFQTTMQIIIQQLGKQLVQQDRKTKSK